MLVQGPGAATRLGCRNVGIRTWDLLAEAPVGSWADRLGSLFVLGKRPSLGCLPPPPPPGQKGGLSATPLMKNRYSKQTPLLVPVPASDRGDCAVWRLPPRRRVRLFRLRGERDL